MSPPDYATVVTVLGATAALSLLISALLTKRHPGSSHRLRSFGSGLLVAWVCSLAVELAFTSVLSPGVIASPARSDSALPAILPWAIAALIIGVLGLAKGSVRVLLRMIRIRLLDWGPSDDLLAMIAMLLSSGVFALGFGVALR